MEREIVLEIVRVTEAAALSSAHWMGRGRKDDADEAATQAMRHILSTIQMDGVVVIGEGEMDDAPMLYIGEKVGRGPSPKVDIAVDPLECTTMLASGMGDALSVIAVSPRGTMLHAPDVYMEKLAVGPAAKGKVNIDDPVAENVKAVAIATAKDVSDVTVAVLNRPRHRHIIEEILAVGARVKLMSHGDIVPALCTAIADTGIDMLVGLGGAPEGVLAAAGLKCLGGEMQARLAPHHRVHWERCQEMGLRNPCQVLLMEDLVEGDDVIFAATGVTDGVLLNGVRRLDAMQARTHSLVMRSKTGTIRFVETTHDLAHKESWSNHRTWSDGAHTLERRSSVI